MPSPRIGAVICDCLGQISDIIDTEILETQTRNLSHVVFAKRVGALCNQKESDILLKELDQAEADRLLFVGCSPRSSLRFPEEQISRLLSGSNIHEHMLEVANIREQCAWLHDPGPAANSKAMDEISMAHARLLGDEPHSSPVKIEEKALIVGGGPAGLASAKELASMGLKVSLVEQGTYLGGRLCQIRLLFQSENWNGRCINLCVGPVQALGAVFEPNISVYTQSGIEEIEKVQGNFRAKIKSGAGYVDPDKCVSCGKCAEVCPEYAYTNFDEGLFSRKAIDKDFPRAVPDSFNLLEEFCTKCGECVQVCPANAINLEAEPKTIEDTFGSVFLATGFDSYDLNQNAELNYRSSDVISGIEFERLLDHGVKCPSSGEVPEHIVFVLCAGSRATQEKQDRGVPYCSKTCCGYTMRQAQQIAMTLPETAVTIVYYYDIRTYERTFEALYDMIKKMGVEFVKGDIEAIEHIPDQGLNISLSQLDDQTSSSMGEYVFEDGKLDIQADLVVLASAQTPKLESLDLVRQLGIVTDKYNFPIENQPRIFRPTESFVERAYMAGASSGPKVVQQSVEQGKAAAINALPYLLRGEKNLPKFLSRIEPETCIQCRFCESICPHGAIKINEQGMISDQGFCQGCGLCVAACPTHAAGLGNFTRQQLLDQVDVGFQGVEEGNPKILALLCYWCSYCGADLAGTFGLRAPNNFRTIRIRCSSSVHTADLLEMFRRGVDGIIIGGCPPNSCHHVHGNYLADKRVSLFSKLLDQLGLDANRLFFDNIGVPHSQKFVDLVTGMDKNLRKLGPNPIALLSKEKDNLEIANE